MVSKYTYQLTRKAENDLDSIVRYMAIELSNVKAAKDFLDKVEAVVDEIRNFPDSGVLIDNEYIEVGDIRRKQVNNYLMYYQKNEEEKVINILRIVYGKRNLEEIIKNFNSL